MNLRVFLVDVPKRKHVEYYELQDVVCRVLQVWPVRHLPPYVDAKMHIQKCEWYFVYDILEALYTLIARKTQHYNPGALSDFCKEVNQIFVAEDIGWQLRGDGQIVIRGDEEFERTLGSGVQDLNESKRPMAAQHLKSAIGALSQRPKANTAGTVAHATSSLECVLNDVTGEALTLGKYLDRYPSLFHPALKKALDGIYGYASDSGARHGKEGVEPSTNEAEFVVAICAAACSLITKQPPPNLRPA